MPNPFILFAAPLEDGRLERVVVPWEFIVETQAAEGDAAVRAQEDRMGLHLYRTLTGRDAISPGP